MNTEARKPLPPMVPLVVLCAVAFVVNVAVNHPYRPFPTDELWSYAYPLQGADWRAAGDDVVLNSPVHVYALLAVERLVAVLGLDWFQTFLVAAALSLSLAALFLGLTVQAATGRLHLSLGAMVLLLVSAWSQTYLHFYTYAPVSALFATASLYCVARVYLAGAGLAWTFAAGLLAGLFFLSSSSARLTCGLLLCAYGLWVLLSSDGRKYRHLLALLAGAALPVVGLLPLYLAPFLDHLRANLGGGHATACYLKHGLVPETPFLSFFYLLATYSPATLALLLASLVVAALAGKRLARSGRSEILALTLLCVVVVHSVVLDLLPFTKLGRSQYVLLPLVLASAAILCAAFQSRARWIGRLLLVLCLLVVPFDLARSVDTWRVRRAAPARLEALPGDTAFYFLNEDPHAYSLLAWLDGSERQCLWAWQLPGRVAERSHPVALVVGPTGVDSGKSILRHCVLDDFSFELPKGIPEAPAVMRLPYYAHYPLFLMEEENSQFFYFYRHVPRMSDPQAWLTVYYWPARSQ